MVLGTMFFMMPGGGELMVIGILVIVLLFGAAKVPQLAKSFGQAMGEFKKAKRESELSLKQFEDSIVGDEKVIPETTAKADKKDKDVNIRDMAAYMGIDTEGKTDDELKEELAKLKSSAQ